MHGAKADAEDEEARANENRIFWRQFQGMTGGLPPLATRLVVSTFHGVEWMLMASVVVVNSSASGGRHGRKRR